MVLAHQRPNAFFVITPTIALSMVKFVKGGGGDEEVPKGTLMFPSLDPTGTPYRACGQVRGTTSCDLEGSQQASTVKEAGRPVKLQ